MSGGELGRVRPGGGQSEVGEVVLGSDQQHPGVGAGRGRQAQREGAVLQEGAVHRARELEAHRLQTRVFTGVPHL